MAKNQNFRNPTYYILLDPEFYTDHYSQKKTIPQRVTVKKILFTVCHYIQKHWSKNENVQ